MRVQIENLTKCFGDVIAVEDATFEVADGELFFLLGPSGCGKTTLLRLLAGFYAPDRGEISFDARRMNGVPPHRRNTGMVFQNYALWPHMTVFQNVEYGLRVRRVAAAERRQRVREALEQVRMGEFTARFPNQLSGGQQQRVALARALVIDPDVMLLDEPLSNLDARLRLELREEIKRVHGETKITTVYVTHDQKEALSMADRVALMHEGRIVQVGTPREIYRNPRSVFAADFLGEMNSVRGTVSEVSGRAARIDTALGSLVSSQTTGARAAGQAVVAMVRPESISISVEAPARSPDVNVLPARLVGRTYLGEIEEYRLALDDGSVWKVFSTTPLTSGLHEGAGLYLRFATGDLLLRAG